MVRHSMLSLPGRRCRLLVATGLLVMVGCTYATGLDIPYYGDDFELYFPASDVHWTELFFWTGPAVEFYRPLQNAPLALIQSTVGMNPVPVHLVTFAAHLAVVGLVYEGARWLGTSQRAALLAALTMGVAQANAAGVLGNDTLSQVGTTFFGYLAVRLYGARCEYESAVCLTDAFVLATLACSFLFKEAGVAFALPILVVEGIDGLRALRKGEWASLAGSGLRLSSVCLLVGGYLFLRAGTGAVSPGVGEGAYQYWFGINLVRNASLFAAAAASVVPTTSIALWAQTGSYLPLVGSLLGMGVLGSVVCYGLAHGNYGPTAGGLLLLAGLSLAPVLPLNDVSELYVYAAMPAFSTLVGLGFDEVLSSSTGWKQAGGALLIGLYFLGQAWGVRQKSSLMERTGNRTQAVLDQLVSVARTAPQDALLCLRDEPSADTTAYSVYRMPRALPFHFAEPVVQSLAGRPDVDFRVGEANCGQASRDHVGLQFRADGEKVEPVSLTDEK